MPVQKAGWSLAPRSFRAKFVLVVGGALLFDLLLSGGLTLWNVQRLSFNATEEVGQGLEKASEEYLQNYIATTAERADLLFDRYHAEVNALAGAMEASYGNKALTTSLGEALATTTGATTPLDFHPLTPTGGGWWQNGPGEPSAVTVWGYLLDSAGAPVPAAREAVRDSAVFNVFGPALQRSGPPKLQMYFMGPYAAPILRSTPYSDQGSVFDRVYPGHNQTNWWDFFFPGLYQDFEAWAADPSRIPVKPNPIVMLAPYLDGVTGKTIVSFFQPVMPQKAAAPAGVVGVDLTLDQMAQMVESVHIADTGFAFLAQSNGNVLAVSPTGAKTLDLQSDSSGFQRLLRDSRDPGVAGLSLPVDETTTMRTVQLHREGGTTPFIAVMKRLSPTNFYDGKGPVRSEALTLGFMVPEEEIYASLTRAKSDIVGATQGIIGLQVGVLLASMVVILAAVYAVSGRITAGLSALANAARLLQKKDYSVRVDIPSRDEVGAVGIAFNNMAEEIRFHTENLEALVAKRTTDLERANGEILELNARLKNENLRLGAELDIARRIQMMVLPKPEELAALDGLQIAGYMSPADEVGGDYFDVLKKGRGIKVGIGDVTGHGLESGVLMLMVQSVALGLQEQGDEDPASFLDVLNRAICKNNARTGTDKHLSLAFLDYADDMVTVCGQHEEVLVIRADGSVKRINTMDLGFPIGLETDIAPFLATMVFPFRSGDIVVLHTDGVTEAENPEGDLFGMDRLVDSALRHRTKPVDAIKAGIIDDLMAHIGTQKIHDDITLVIMRHA